MICGRIFFFIPFFDIFVCTYKNEQNTDEITNIFPLDPTLNYKFFIHDPKFYHILTKSQ